MYYLNKDGSIDNSLGIDNDPVIVSGNLIEPHIKNCKCVKCFVKHQIGDNETRGLITVNNILIVIIFCVMMYLIYVISLRVCM